VKNFIQTSTFTNNDFQKAVSGYVDNFSYRNLSAKTGINRRTISKFATGEGDVTRIDPLKIANLYKTVFRLSDIKDAIEMLPEGVKEKLYSMYSVFLDDYSARELMESDEKQRIEEILRKDESYYVLFLLSFGHSGVSLKKASEVLGSKLGSSLNFLLKQNLVKLDNQNIIPSIDENQFYFSPEFIKNNMQSLVDYFQVAKRPLGMNYMIHKTESLTVDALKELRELTRQYHMKVREIASKTENHGENPFFISLAMDTFCDTKDSNPGVLQ